MKNLVEKLKSISRIQIAAILLIIIGLAIMVPKAKGMFEFSQEARYAAENNFAAGDLSTDLLRPWMSIRYISVAYAVPQKYIFESTGIQPKKETSMISLNRLNRQLSMGSANGQPALVQKVREAIEAYRANPVATGLIEKHVEDWMTVQYIANSTGIPAETIFTEAGIPEKGNANKPLGFLADEINYPGGGRALADAVNKVVDALAPQKGNP